MKICKYVVGGVAIIVSIVVLALYFVTKADPTSALAVASYYPTNVTNVDSTVYVAWAIALIGTFVGGLISVIFAGSRKGEAVMVTAFAIGFLASLMYSLLIPALLWIAIVDFVGLMFSVSYSQLENDIGGKL